VRNGALRYQTWDGAILDMRPNQVTAVTSVGRPPMEQPISVRLSRYRYPAEDGHLDVIVRFDLDLDQRPDGRLEVALITGEGLVTEQNAVSEQTISPILGSQLFFSYHLPDSLAGGNGTLRGRWVRDGAPTVESSAKFVVAERSQVARTGRVLLKIANSTGATFAAPPMKVGVPFPRGAVDSADHLRLIDEQGNQLPLQIVERARWSRFGGGVKWALCDFTLDLHGAERTVYVKYGPHVTRERREAIHVDPQDIQARRRGHVLEMAWVGCAQVVQQTRSAHRSIIAPVIGVDIQVSIAVVVAECEALPVTKNAVDSGTALNRLFGEVAVTVVEVQVEPGATTGGDIKILVTVIVDVSPSRGICAVCIWSNAGDETGGQGDILERAITFVAIKEVARLGG